MNSEFFVASSASFKKLKIIEDDKSIALVNGCNTKNKIIIHSTCIIMIVLFCVYMSVKHTVKINLNNESLVIVVIAGVFALMVPIVTLIIDWFKFNDYIIKYNKENNYLYTKYGEPCYIDKIECFLVCSMRLGKPNKQQVQIKFAGGPSNLKSDRLLVYPSAFSLSSGRLLDSFMDFARRIEKPLIIRRL